MGLRTWLGLKNSKSIASAEPIKPDFVIAKQRTAEDASDPVVTFGITLASAQTVASWHLTQELLSATLRSVLRQSSNSFRVLIAGHEQPHIPEIMHPKVEFISMTTRPPKHRSQFRTDKARKRHALGRRLLELGAGYFMQLDADDLVHRELVARCLSDRNSWGSILCAGWAYDRSGGLIAPVPGVWPFDLDRICGSCAVVYYTADDLPRPEHSPADPTVVFNMTRQHAYLRVVYEELERPLRPMETPMIVYVLNHSQNLSFQMQKSTQRGRTVIERISEQRVTDPTILASIKEAFGEDLLLGQEIPANTP